MLIIIALLLIVTYSAQILQFTYSWISLNNYNSNAIENKNIISCIIAFRNEENNITELIKNLSSQNLKNTKYEVILIDDFSTDNSYSKAVELCSKLPNFSVLKNTDKGKKSAIKTGVNNSQGNYIVTTDADCIHTKKWLEIIYNFISKNNSDFVSAPVFMKSKGTLFENFQQMDFASLIISGAGAIGMRNAIMCNGANLVVRKSIYLKAIDSINNKYASGDDMFLLQYCKKNHKKIEFLKSQDSIVSTFALSSFKDFLNQRARWTSKSKGYSDIFTLYIAWLVLLANISFVILFFYMFSVFTYITWIPLSLKILSDYILINSGKEFFGFKLNLLEYILFSFIYPFSILIIIFYSLFINIKWKERKI